MREYHEGDVVVFYPPPDFPLSPRCAPSSTAPCAALVLFVGRVLHVRDTALHVLPVALLHGDGLSSLSSSLLPCPPRSRHRRRRCHRDGLSVRDVAELTRRRAQLSLDMETSVARVAEIRRWLRRRESGESHSEAEVNNAETEADSTETDNAEAHSPEAHNAEAHSPEAEDEQRALMSAVTAARAALCAVDSVEWHSLRCMRQPPPAVTFVSECVRCLLGLSQQQQQHQQSTSASTWRMRDLRQLMLRRDPAAVTQREAEAVRKLRLEETWPRDRAARVHGALGPMHDWVRAVLAVAEARHMAQQQRKQRRQDKKQRQLLGGAEAAALLREMEEHEEYVQLARDELDAIDALLADAAALNEEEEEDGEQEDGEQEEEQEGEEQEGESSWSSLHMDSEKAAGRRGVSLAHREVLCSVPRTELRAEEPFVSDAAIAIVRDTLHAKENQLGNKTNSEDQMNNGNISIRHASHEAVPRRQVPISPRRPHDIDIPVPPLSSLRERFGQLHKSPRIRSPRIGCAARQWSPHRVGALQERADLLSRVHELEDCLLKAYEQNPGAAEMQQMRDEIYAVRAELAAVRKECDELRAQRTLHPHANPIPTPIAEPFAVSVSVSTSTGPAVGDVYALEEQLRVVRLDLAAAEERLNREMQSHSASRAQAQQLRAELRSVWRRLELAEPHSAAASSLSQPRSDHISQSQSQSQSQRQSQNQSQSQSQSQRQRQRQRQGQGQGHEGTMERLQRQLRDREATVERLRVELEAMRRRHKEVRQKHREGRAARAEMLSRVEAALAEALRRQECSLQAIPDALRRAREEMTRLGAKR